MADPVVGVESRSEIRKRVHTNSGSPNGVQFILTPRRPLPQIYNLPYQSPRLNKREAKHGRI